MVTVRYCRRRLVNTATKIIFFAVQFVFMAQMTYLHTHIWEETRENFTQHLTRITENKRDLKDGLSSTRGCLLIAPKNVPPLLSAPDLFLKSPYHPLVYGKPRQKKGYLTIGIPSVKRPNTDKIYLYDTLDSLLEKIPEVENHQITIVVMVSDANMTYNTELTTSVYRRYKAFCDNGMINVINTIDCMYPDLDNVRQTFNDSHARLKWRAKQNIDFAFMMLYSRNLSQFYIQLEDDVIAATDFIQDIRNFIWNISQTWFLLEFSRLGFIGKLFKSSDLGYVSFYLLKHYDLAPCDYLLITIRNKRGQKTPIYGNKSLFQHIGRFSSLKNKLMPAFDWRFKDGLGIDLNAEAPAGDNPPAEIRTSMKIYGGHIPKHAYDNDNTTYFWGETPRKKDHFTLKFNKLYNFSRIIISTGAFGTKKDSFFKSVLLYSYASSFKGTDDKYACANRFFFLEELLFGEIDTDATGTIIPKNVKCLKILAMEDIRNWIIIRDIKLFVAR